jgi:hypothetical protein
MKRITFMAFAILSLLQTAFADPEQRYAKIQLERELESELRTALAPSLAGVNFDLKVSLQTRGLDKKIITARAHLPGFTVDEEKKAYFESKATIDIDSQKAKILGAAQSALVSITLDERDLNQIDQEKLKSLLNSGLSSVNIPVYSTIAVATKVITADRVPASKSDNEVKTEKFVIQNEMPKFSPIINANLKMDPPKPRSTKDALLSWIYDKSPILVLGLALLWYLSQFSKTLESASKKISSALDLKAGQHNQSNSWPKDSRNSTLASPSSFQSSFEGKREFIHWLREHESIAVGYVSGCIKMKQYEEVLVFMDAWPELVKSAWGTEGFSSAESNWFNEYLRLEGKKVLMDDHKLAELRRQVEFNLKNMILDDKAYYSNGMIAVVTSWSASQFWEFFSKLSEHEKSLMVSLTPNIKLAEFVVAESEKIHEIKEINIIEAPKEDELKSLFAKAFEWIKRPSLSGRPESKLEHLSRLLPYHQEKVLLSAVAPQAQSSLEIYYSQFFPEIVGWINKLNIQEACQILAVLGEDMQQKILLDLPEIKARRMAAMGFKMGPESLYLKAKLMEFMEEFSPVPEIPNEESNDGAA